MPALALGDAISRTLEPGAVHSFRLQVEGVHFLHIELDQDGVDATLRLLAPHGEEVAVASGPGGAQGEEVLATVTPRPGVYTLEVRPQPASAGGSYTLRWQADRPSEPGDGYRIAALGAQSDGLQLLALRLPKTDRRAADLLAEAAAAWHQVGNTGAEGWAHTQAARALLRLQEGEAALAHLRQAVPLFRSNGDKEGESAAQGAMGSAFKYLSRFDQAIEHYQRAYDLLLEIGLDRDRAAVLNNIGDLHMSMDQPEVAERYYVEALELVRQQDLVLGEITVLINLGRAYDQLGAPERSFEVLRQADDLVQRHGLPRHRVHLLANLGNYHLAVGELTRSLNLLHEGIDLAEELGELRAEYSFHQLLGRQYRVIGDPQTAGVHHRRALELARTQQNLKNEAASLLSLGILLREQGEIELALEHLTRARGVADEARARALEAAAIREMGSAHVASGQWQAGRESLEQAEELARESGVVPELAATLRALAEAQHLLGHNREARATLRRALDLNLRLDNPLEYGTICVQLARLEKDSGDLQAARELFLEALDVHRTVRDQIRSPELRARFLSRWREHYQELVELLMELDRRHPDDAFAGEAFAITERARARQMVELLAESKILPRSGDLGGLAAREEEISRRLSLLQSELIRAVGGESTSVRVDNLRRSLLDARQDHETVERRLRRLDPAYAGIRYPEPLDLTASQNLLDAGDALLAYELCTDGSYLFVLRRDRFEVIRLPDRERIEGPVIELLGLLRQNDPRSAHRMTRLLRTLRSVLVTPAEHLLDGVDRLWVVPDGSLFYLPLELLLTGERSDGLPMNVAYVPSASVLADLDERSRRQPAAAADAPLFVAFAGAIGDGETVAGSGAETPSVASRRNGPFAPLVGSVEEVESIASLFPGRARTYLGAAAHQGNVFDNEEVRETRWLHFAAHGVIREDDPTISGLLLSPDARGDTILQVFEILDLRLSTELVVLSACETGVGGTRDGEGLVGLSHAFFYAGSSNVVVSLWPVSDQATAELMRAFYTGMAAGLAPSAALRRAKVGMMRQASFRHPTFWAPFILVGRDR